MAIIAGRACRVFIGGVDVSRYVRDVKISAGVDSAAYTVVEFIELPRVEPNGQIHLCEKEIKEEPATRGVSFGEGVK